MEEADVKAKVSIPYRQATGEAVSISELVAEKEFQFLIGRLQAKYATVCAVAESMRFQFLIGRLQAHITRRDDNE